MSKRKRHEAKKAGQEPVGMPNKITAANAELHKDEAKRVILEGDWQDDGKSRELTVEDGGLAVAIRQMIQQQVVGAIPRMVETSEGFSITVKANHLKHVQQQLGQEPAAGRA